MPFSRSYSFAFSSKMLHRLLIKVSSPRYRLIPMRRANGRNEKVMLLAENAEILSEVSDMLSDNPAADGRSLLLFVRSGKMPTCMHRLSAAADGRFCGLYGRGNTVPILNDLDRGRISGICVTDDFSIGYLSVCLAVQTLEGKDNIPIMADFY